MAKGEGVAAPMCRNCNEAHWKEPGKVRPKFRSKKVIVQPTPLRLPAPSKAPVAAAPALPAPQVIKKAKKAKKKRPKVKKPSKPAPAVAVEST